MFSIDITLSRVWENEHIFTYSYCLKYFLAWFSKATDFLSLIMQVLLLTLSSKVAGKEIKSTHQGFTRTKNPPKGGVCVCVD